MKISEVADRCDVNIQTIRFYERRGLLRDPRDGVDGYREYDDADVDRLQFIKQAQALGFSLKEVDELLALRAGSGTAAAVRARAQDKLQDVRGKIAALRRLERVLLGLVEKCPGRGGLEACPILQGLEQAGPSTNGSTSATRRKKKRRSR